MARKQPRESYRVRCILLPMRCGEPGCLGGEIVPFGNARRSARSGEVVRNRGLMIPGHLVQMGSNGVEPVVTGQPSVVVQGPKELEPRAWTLHHCSRDSVIERHHGIIGDALEQTIEGKDLLPVGILGARSFIVDRGDCSLELVRAGRRASVRSMSARSPAASRSCGSRL